MEIEPRQKTIVFTNGCFDILHRGHVEYLQKSKALGDILVVGINSDASVKRLKGYCRPINNQQDRMYMLKALECVDEVLVFNEDTPLNIIESLRPNIITKGGDYTVEEVVGHDIVPETYIISLTNGYSTTNFIERIRDDSA
jgi:rfaE bifunctional protein nucleotidyltransferase chain/domain